jgi:transposase
VWARRGSCPRAVKQTEYEWVYCFGAVCPERGAAHACLLPLANTEAMNLYLTDFSSHLAPDTHAVMVMDRAGWHTAERVKVPSNMTLVSLPPYSPELNPQELVWRELRRKYLSNRAYATVAELDDAVANAWVSFTKTPDIIRSLTRFPYISSALKKCF